VSGGLPFVICCPDWAEDGDFSRMTGLSHVRVIIGLGISLDLLGKITQAMATSRKGAVCSCGKGLIVRFNTAKSPVVEINRADYEYVMDRLAEGPLARSAPIYACLAEYDETRVGRIFPDDLDLVMDAQEVDPDAP
jgi:hypothetical protein